MIISRKKIQNIGEIQCAFQFVKNQNKTFRTNFFLDPVKHNIWIKNGEFEIINFTETVLLIHSKIDFKTLFYISPGLSELGESLNIFIKEKQNEKYVTDLIGLENMFDDVLNVFNGIGFNKRSTLMRMSCTNYAEKLFANDWISFANISEVPLIHNLLQKYFDKYVDQLPMSEELINWVENQHLLVYRFLEKIGGFLIYDSTINTAYLRYWFVHPDFRDQKIGSKLIRKFFEMNKNVKRWLFWVKEDNKNAIKRYIHYGFGPEKLKDLVLTFNIK